MALGATSGQTLWQPAIAEFVLDALSRNQIRGAEITTEHIVEARRSGNLLLSDWGNRGTNLWKIGDPDVCIALQGTVTGYPLPIDTVDLLDCYLRTFTPSATTTDLGPALTALTSAPGDPLVTEPWGEPMVVSPSGLFTATAGSLFVSLYWPNHGLSFGDPVFWSSSVAIGALSLSNFTLVSYAIDPDHVALMAPSLPPVSRAGQGGPPLYATASGSSSVKVILPGHGLQPGGSFTVGVSTAVGGLTLSGAYTVASVTANPAAGYPSYEFAITAGGSASSSDVAFENSGRVRVATQLAGTLPTDIFLYPISRNDYAMLPLKEAPGNPTSYWYDRTYPPSVRVWPVTPIGSYLGFIGHRLRDIQVANPIGGQVLDAPRRFYEAFVSGLTARLAEKFRPKQFAAKLALAEAAWWRASDEDREKANLSVVPEMTAYFT